ncbi:hypothetical protein HK100_001942 [Physocladia obscura]|uniref:Uncharacterized protein n=1 Tax=Physocladia obscura TaxID=109957 RepID=A0AAD5SWD5_9FUNG|nr:hypothetical protein HK100_001942 [Physocladia obscura]
MKTQKEFLEWTKANLGSFHIQFYANAIIQLPLSTQDSRKVQRTTNLHLESYLDKNNLRGVKAPSRSGPSQTTEESEATKYEEDKIEISLSDTYQTNIAHSIHQINNNTLPFNEHLIYELSKQIVLGNQFDMVMQSVEDFQTAENKMWAGRIWSNLTNVRPITTRDIYSVPPTVGDSSVFEGGLEHLLRIIFTKFADREFAEGVFLLRAEFGADWFSPILQHPYCILRHTSPPAPIEIPISNSIIKQNDSSPELQDSNVSSTPSQTLASSAKRQKRTPSAPISLPLATTAGGSSINVPTSAAMEPDLLATMKISAPPLTASVQPPFESFVMFYLGPNVKEFCNVFRSVALVPGINSWCAIVGGTSGGGDSGGNGGNRGGGKTNSAVGGSGSGGSDADSSRAAI